eukprot:1160702-Pelagomonas_calceolata.AAC.6
MVGRSQNFDLAYHTVLSLSPLPEVTEGLRSGEAFRLVNTTGIPLSIFALTALCCPTQIQVRIEARRAQLESQAKANFIRDVEAKLRRDKAMLRAAKDDYLERKGLLEVRFSFHTAFLVTDPMIFMMFMRVKCLQFINTSSHGAVCLCQSLTQTYSPEKPVRKVMLHKQMGPLV